MKQASCRIPNESIDAICRAYPYGIELIHRYRREDERIQDKNCWSLGEEERRI